MGEGRAEGQSGACCSHRQEEYSRGSPRRPAQLNPAKGVETRRPHASGDPHPSRTAKSQAGRPRSAHPRTPVDAGGGGRWHRVAGGRLGRAVPEPLAHLISPAGRDPETDAPRTAGGGGSPPPWEIRGVFHNGGNITPLRSQGARTVSENTKTCTKKQHKHPQTLHYSPIHWSTKEKPLLIKLLNC